MQVERTPARIPFRHGAGATPLRTTWGMVRRVRVQAGARGAGTYHRAPRRGIRVATDRPPPEHGRVFDAVASGPLARRDRRAPRTPGAMGRLHARLPRPSNEVGHDRNPGMVHRCRSRRDRCRRAASTDRQVTRPYAERRHRSAVAALKAHPVPCWRGCGRMATTVGHVPPLARHEHRAGSGCCDLRPECGPCNYGEGARLVNARRSRLTPGGGWSR